MMRRGDMRALSFSMSGSSEAAGVAEIFEDYEEDDNDEIEPEEGHEFVYADGVADFAFPFQMEEEDGNMTVNAVGDFEDAEGDMDYEVKTDIPIPLNELVTGMVRRGNEEGNWYEGKWGMSWRGVGVKSIRGGRWARLSCSKTCCGHHHCRSPASRTTGSS